MRNLKKSIVVLILLFVLVSGNLAAAGKVNYKALAKKVDALFAPYDRTDSPGAAVLIMKGGKVLYQRGYGMANLEYDIPITPATVFHIASDSKQFTAFAILLLAAEGKLALDDDIHLYLPRIPDFGKKITIRNLLNHTSGLRDQWELLIMAGWRMDDVITQDQILRLVEGQKELNFNPGTEYLYSNTNYTLLAEIVAKVSGQSFTEFTQKRIFEPLGMNRTHFHDDYTKIVKNMAYSYAPVGAGFQKCVLSYATVGATSLFTTTQDLAQWIDNFEHPRVGDAAIMTEMQTPGKLNNGVPINYACGLLTGYYNGLKYIWHDGADAGYRSAIYRFPKQHFAVAILSNAATLSPNQLAVQIADLYLNHVSPNIPPAAPPKQHREVAADPEAYSQYIGRYQLQPGFIITVSKEKDHLMTQATGQDKFEIYPEGKDAFFAKIAEIQVIFVRDGAGMVTGLRVLQSGQDFPAPRMDEPILTEAQLAEYCGQYYSEELATTYRFSLKDGQLIVQHLRLGELPLEPVKTDRLICLGINLFFQRDPQNRVTGFLVSSGRVRNLRFDKVN